MTADDFFLVFCTTKNGELVVGGMTLDQTALALSEFGTSFQIRLRPGAAERKLTNIFVYWEVFQQVSQRYGFGHRLHYLCDECLETYVLTSALLGDGRWVRVGITLRSCLKLVANPETTVDVEYRTKEKLGDDICFIRFYIDPSVAAVLEGRKKFCPHLA